MSRNLPFITTIFITLAITAYMLFDPSEKVMEWMEITYINVPFKLFILGLGLGNFALAYVSERYLFPGLSKWIGVLKVKLNPRWKKERKAYKVIAEGMRM
jgi:cation-transporting ATPase 13A2